MWKFLDPDLRPGGDPHVPCPGECGGAKLFETDRKTKGAEGPRAGKIVSDGKIDQIEAAENSQNPDVTK